MPRRLLRIFWLGLKEISSLRRDTVLLILLVYSFSGGVLLEATGISTSVNKASIAFVDEDGSALSRNLASGFFPPEFQKPVQISAEEVDAAMDGDRFLFAVIVPPRFEADLLAGRTAELQVLIDATAVQQAGIGASYILNILGDEIHRFATGQDLEGPPAIRLVQRSAFNPNRDTVQFESVVSLVNNITMLTVILTGAALIREREHGTIEHLLAMPLSPLDIALAKIWACWWRRSSRCSWWWRRASA